MAYESDTPQQTPEGALIETARTRLGMSARRAAVAAGISDARWQQIENGYQSVAKGIKTPVVGPAETLARMAIAVRLPYQSFEGVRVNGSPRLKPGGTVKTGR